MPLPAIDIAAVPMLETAVGLFGSGVTDSAISEPSVFEVGVTVILIIFD